MILVWSAKPYWDRYSDEMINAPRTAAVAQSEMDPHSRGLYYHYGLGRLPIDDALLRRARHGYYAMMSYIDDRVGDLLDALSACGLLTIRRSFSPPIMAT